MTCIQFMIAIQYLINAVNSIFYDATGKNSTEYFMVSVHLRIKEIIITQKIIFGKTLKF